MRNILLLCLTLGVALAAGPVRADEAKIKLKPGPGREKVEANCVACHSLDYIEMNSVFLERKVWEAEITKMVKAFGAPVKDEDQKEILEYLVKYYGKG